MRFYFPNESRFFAENFAYQPLNLIFQALRCIDKLTIEQHNYAAIPIANLGVANAASQGAKNPKPEWFNPYPKLLANLEDTTTEILPHVGETFKQLCKEGKVPTWAVGYLELD